MCEVLHWVLTLVLVLDLVGSPVSAHDHHVGAGGADGHTLRAVDSPSAAAALHFDSRDDQASKSAAPALLPSTAQVGKWHPIVQAIVYTLEPADQSPPLALAGAAWTLCGGALASSHIVDIVWSPEGRFTHQGQIAAGKFVEVCGKLAVENNVRWRFTAAAPVDFNIHYHVGKEAVFPVKKAQVAGGADTLKVAVAQDYCWMWTNKGSAPVGLTVELAR